MLQFAVEQAYWAVPDSKGIPYTQERGGGRNLFVVFERHREVFAAAAAHVEDVESGLGARHWNQIKDEVGFITEAVLETALISRWSIIKAFEDLDLLGDQVDSVDIVARHRRSGALVLAVGATSAAAAAPTPAQRCAADVELASAKYAQCRLVAESRFSKDLDATRRTAALARCSDKLQQSFERATLRYGAACTSEPVSGFDQYLAQCSDDVVAASVMGGSLPACGDGSIDVPGEQCDGSDLGGASCASLGFAGGALACNGSCAFDTATCQSAASLAAKCSGN